MRIHLLPLLFTLLALVPAETQAAPAPKPATVLVTPSGATLRPGESVTFSAIVLDKRGNVMTGVPVTWRSSANGILAIDNAGLATANGAGTATVQAKARGKVGKAFVTVVNDAGSAEKLMAAGLKQVNHILHDAEWIYWCETGTKDTRVRKMRKTGGAIYDLAAEPFRSRTGLTTTYVQLQQIGDQLYFTRQQKGFNFHWSILSVPKAGGDLPEVILPEDVAQEPLATNAWRVSGDRLIVSLFSPTKIGLGSAVRLATYSPATELWTPIYGGPFEAGEVHIIAADDTHVYVRGFDFDARNTLIVKVALDGSGSPATLLSRSGTDLDVDEPGATDGTNLYYWSFRESVHRLLSLPISGGEPTTLITNAFGPGLTYADGKLYWARVELNEVSMPVSGGNPTPVRTNIFATATVGGIPVDDTSVYIAILISRTEIRIIRVNR